MDYLMDKEYNRNNLKLNNENNDEISNDDKADKEI